MTWTNAAQMGPKEWYEMYVRTFHPELALVGMQVLSQVISASSCKLERKWPAHGNVHLEVRKRVAPATTEKLVYIYSKRKAVVAAVLGSEQHFARFLLLCSTTISEVLNGIHH